MNRLLTVSALLFLAAACSKSEPPPPAAATPASAPASASSKGPAITTMPKFDSAPILDRIKAMSADEFEGRAPGTKGEELTVQYLEEEFKKLGLQPGNTDGTFVQKVPLVGITGTNTRPLTIAGAGATKTFKWKDEVVAWTKHVADGAAISDSEMIFAGYGVTAPEFNWDDFKGVDVKGKTIVVLVNDPQVPDAADPAKLDDKVFNGKAMTYYGRWTYKFEEGARRGAAGILIVHEEGPAGYPFQVVQGNLREKFDLVTPDKNMGRSAIEGWVTLETARAILKMAGQDFDALKKRSLTRDFKPVPLNLKASIAVKNTLRTIDSRNVLAKLEGSDPTLRNELVVYTAHWDHLGVGDPVNGDRIYNGAIDNASGVAQLLEIAHGFTTVEPKPKRSILFLMVTAEEQGLLGSQYLLGHAGLSSGRDGRQYQHRRHQPVGPHQGHRRHWHGCVGPGRLSARRRHRTGPRAAPGSGVGEGLLLPIGSLQLRQAGRARALRRHRRGVHRQAVRLRHAEAGGIHQGRLSPALGPGEAGLGSERRRRRRAAAVRRGLPRGERGQDAGMEAGE